MDRLASGMAGISVGVAGFVTGLVLLVFHRRRRRHAPPALKPQSQSPAAALAEACASHRFDLVPAILEALGEDDGAKDRVPAACLLEACKEGHLGAVGQLLGRDPGLALQHAGDNAVTALHVAADSGNLEVVGALLRAGAEVEAVDAGGHTPLFLAACNGLPEVVAVLLAHGAAVHVRDKALKTPLHFAAHNGRVDVVAQLLAHVRAAPSAGRDAAVRDLVGVEDLTGYQALHSACLSNHMRVVEALVGAGASVDAAARDGATPLLIACRSGRAGRELAGWLVAHGADGDVHNVFGSSALHVACGARNLGAVQALAELPAGGFARLVASQDNDGMRPLQALCQAARVCNTQPEIADVLAIATLLCEEGGADVCAMDYGDTTALHYCAAGRISSGILVLAARLLELGASATLENCQGWSPLHLIHNSKPDETHNQVPENVARLLRALDAHAQEHHRAYWEAFDAAKPRDTSNSVYLARRGSHNRIPIAARRAVLDGEHSLAGIARYIHERTRDGATMKIVVMTGAGVSVSCGLPDFRSPGAGIYTNKALYGNAFDPRMLVEDPAAFFRILKRVFYPVVAGDIEPSPTHRFVRLLHDKGHLLRLYTQNVDMLDRLPADKMVEAHGTMASAHCMDAGCNHPGDMAEFWGAVKNDETPLCPMCGAVMVPDVVFFGQGLPQRFHQLKQDDLKEADLLIVMGTSLVVYPFAGMVKEVGPLVPRLLINRERTGPFQHIGLNDGDEAERQNYRDVAAIGECDAMVAELCRELGWQLPAASGL